MEFIKGTEWSGTISEHDGFKVITTYFWRDQNGALIDGANTAVCPAIGAIGYIKATAYKGEAIPGSAFEPPPLRTPLKTLDNAYRQIRPVQGIGRRGT